MHLPINSVNGFAVYCLVGAINYMVRIIAGRLLLTVGSGVLMTNSQEFRNLYGEPDLERYIARPGNSVTVTCGFCGDFSDFRVRT
jgi:hypothetical protein